MSRIYVPANEAEDWKRLLAKPDKHWKTGHSAMALAHSWQEADDFPESVKRVFRTSGIALFENIKLLLAFPEYKVDLPGGRRPSQNDIFILATGDSQLISIMVEGKVSEPFGDTVAKWKQNSSQGKRCRLESLLETLALGKHKPIDNIAYQLLHRTASALIEARSFKAKNALMLVHSFSQSNECFEDYSQFLALFDLEAKPDSLVFAKNINGINLYFCWVKGNYKYLGLQDAKIMRMRVDGPFISRKTAVEWPEYGMSKKKHENWLRELKASLQRNKESNDWLKNALQEGRRLKLKVRIYGMPQRIRLLDIHDATAQIIDEITECLFPKEEGKPTPQVQDRHFWKIEGEKFISSEERVEVEVEES